MDELTLITSESFEDIECDFYTDGDDFYMTREQIGTALSYENPRDGIRLVHSRHRERLDKYSRRVQVELPQGGTQNLVVYSRKGILEICRWSDMPKANEFIDWVWDVMDALIKCQAGISPTPPEAPLANLQGMSIMSKLYNAQVRKAREYENLAKLYPGTDYGKILESYASHALSGEHLIPLPETDRETFSATEIGEILGIHRFRVGHLANENNLKTKEYGVWAFDVAPDTHKQVQVFRYYGNVIPVMKKLL